MNSNDTGTGVVATLSELIRTRPSLKATGFAPGGKVSTHQFGTNRSVFSGRGMEFDESRAYQPGDDVKAIDWRVTARTGTVHTKLFREERERPVFVLLDCRATMHFGTRVRFKSVLAAHVAAMLCWVAVDGGDRVGGFVLDAGGLRDHPAIRGRSAMLSLLRTMSAATRAPDGSGNPEPALHLALRRLRHACRPGTLAFVVSDYADLDDLAHTELERLSLRAHVTNLLVHDPLEVELPRRRDLRVSDGSRAAALAGLPEARFREHAAAFAQRRARLESLSRQRAMAFHTLSTADTPDAVLHPHRIRAPRAQPRRAAA